VFTGKETRRLVGSYNGHVSAEEVKFGPELGTNFCEIIQLIIYIMIVIVIKDSFILYFVFLYGCSGTRSTVTEAIY
jgi:hypothetical protein